MDLDLSTGNPFARTGDQFALELKKWRAADEITDEVLRTTLCNRKLSKATLTIGTAATVGVAGVTLEAGDTDPTMGILYSIDGYMYSTAGGNAAFTDKTKQPAETTCCYLISVNAAGTLTITNGVVQPSFQGPPGPFVPPLPEGHAPIGVVKIATAASTTFTPATTLLDAVGVTATAYDLAVAVKRLPAA